MAFYERRTQPLASGSQFRRRLLWHATFAVGIMAVAQFLPFSLFGLFAGVFTDRLDARRLVVWTQVSQLVTAVLDATDHATGENPYVRRSA